MKTIVTISTPIGSGAIGIVRMSGDNALSIASRIFATNKLESFANAQPNMMYFGTLDCGAIKDKCLAVYFQAPMSYTGEDVIEFQCHGGIRIVQEVLRACVVQGAVVADKGEFTKRAFLNGKMALSDAEGIIDMINSESLSCINASFRLAMGGVSDNIKQIQHNLLDCIAQLEASLDYPEEMEQESKKDSKKIIQNIIPNLQTLLDTARIGSYIKHGISVAIVGQANVGKSSLLNAFLGKERAIVTDIEGTTRDSLEETTEVEGILLRLIDTAGIRDTIDKIEALGVERSLKIAKSSDIVLFVTVANRNLNEYEKNLINQLKQNGNQKIIMVYNKCDLGVKQDYLNEILISCKQTQGIDLLRKKIVEMFISKDIDNSGDIITNQRHEEAIKNALENLVSGLANLENVPTECTLLDLKTAYYLLGEITGDTASESIIDRIFSSFCLGK